MYIFSIVIMSDFITVSKKGNMKCLSVKETNARLSLFLSGLVVENFHVFLQGYSLLKVFFWINTTSMKHYAYCIKGLWTMKSRNKIKTHLL